MPKEGDWHVVINMSRDARASAFALGLLLANSFYLLLGGTALGPEGPDPPALLSPMGP